MTAKRAAPRRRGRQATEAKTDPSLDASLPALGSAANAHVFNAEKRRAFLDQLANTPFAMTKIAEDLGFSYSTVHHTAEVDEEFAAELERARKGNDRQLALHLQRMATERGINGNVVALFGVLKARMPEIYRENAKVEHYHTHTVSEDALVSARARIASRLIEHDGDAQS